MTNKVYSIKQLKMNKNGGFRAAAAMRWVSWALLGIGLLCCLLNVNEFHDDNLGLMVGIGFIIAGMQVYGIGTFIHLLHTKTDVKS